MKGHSHGLMFALLLAVSIATFSCSSSEHYLIMPINSTSLCNEYQIQTCFTLEKLTNMSSISHDTILTLSFLPGEHFLTQSIEIHNFREVIITGYDTPMISFHENCWIELSDIGILNIENLNFAPVRYKMCPGGLNVKNTSSASFRDSCFSFFNNLQQTDGSTVLVSDAEITSIENVLFDTNFGTTIYIRSTNVSITNSAFTNNSAQQESGAFVRIFSNDTTIFNSTFTNNTALYSVPTYPHSEANTSSNDTTKRNCGAISVYTRSSLHITDSEFTNNIAYNGAVHIHKGSAFISKSQFLHNGAKRHGGAISFTAGNISISDSNFTNNLAQMDGGAIYANADNTFISNSHFTGNIAVRSGNGGAISLNTGDTSISNSNFENNKALVNGGAVHMNGGNISISNSQFTSNNAFQSGGAVNINGSTTTIANSQFIGNIALQNGGAVSTNTGNLAISSSNFASNTAGVYAGAIDNYAGSTSISSSSFTHNEAQLSGGAIENYNGEVSISNSQFTSNIARRYGGAIYNVMQSSNISINKSNFTRNRAVMYGGAIISLGVMSIHESNFTKNSANQYGGAIYSDAGNTLISNNQFFSNSVLQFGGAIYVYEGYTLISNSNFTNNIAQDGGAIESNAADTFISNCQFKYNYALRNGGAVYIYTGNITISSNIFTNNSVNQNGGAVYIDTDGTSTINSQFTYNTAVLAFGGAIYIRAGNTFINNSNLTSNTAYQGGAIMSDQYIGSTTITNSYFSNNLALNIGGALLFGTGNTSVTNSIFTNNTAKKSGGAAFISAGDTSIGDSLFMYNIAQEAHGGAIYFNYNTEKTSIANSQFTENGARLGGGAIFMVGNSARITGSNFTHNLIKTLFLIQSTVSFHNDTNFVSNEGTLHAYDSQVEFQGQTTFSDNREDFGGTIRIVQGQVYFNSTEGTLISNNVAAYGGGISLIQSRLVIIHPVEISDNIASISGGGIHAFQSVIEFKVEEKQRQSFIRNNTAQQNGGGIYAIASRIKISGTKLNVDSNKATANGGGLYLEQNTKIYLIKDVSKNFNTVEVKLEIISNSAQYGGGIFVSDNTTTEALCNAGGTSSSSERHASFVTECFIQTVQLLTKSLDTNETSTNTFLSNNTASRTGMAIYGGLLDRCTVDPYAEIITIFNDTEVLLNQVDYFKKIVLFSETSKDKSIFVISSDPVQVVFCDENLSTVFVRKGQPLTILVKAIDQVGNPLNATIHSSVLTESGVGRLKEGQAEQKVGNQCTELEYNVYSLDSSAQVQLYSDGPCSNLGISLQTFNVSFLPCTCPIGFQQSESQVDCKCKCDLLLKQYQITNCSYEDGTILLETNIWIGVADTTNGTGYVIQDCPFNYCVDKPVNISLNGSYQIDQQCAHNRSGVLCGECEEGLSLVLGTSRCKECSDIFLLMLAPFAIAGITLVAFILVLNITMATGTVHGLIFYSNIVVSSYSIFLPLTSPNLFSVFISWVNLDLGIETCFYDGMNSQAKVLLQLVFPTYLFLLVFLIIILSKYIHPFSKLLSHRNPVAALCTLILLSYSKLVRMIIAAMQYTFLDYPDGSREIVWLYDANVQYFSVSHIPRFIVAGMIIILGGLFTLNLLFGQWLSQFSNFKVFKWTKNTKYIAFIDVYHAPFTPKHRYWMGLQLLALLSHNIIVAMTTEVKYRVLSAGCITLGLIMIKLLSNRIYKNRLQDSLETLFLLNLIILVLGTFVQGNQKLLANTSMAISLILFSAIITYHLYEYILKKTNLWLKIKNGFRNRIMLFIDIQRWRQARNGHEMYQLVNDVDDDQEEEIDYGIDQRDTIDPPYTDGNQTEDEHDPQRYFTPPIIRPAVNYAQLREPDLDILAPINPDDYRAAPPLPHVHNPPEVTYSVIDPITRPDNPPQ